MKFKTGRTLAAVALTGSFVVAMLPSASGASTAKSVPGVTAHQVVIGSTQPITGIASAGYNQIAGAANAVFKYVNAKGGVNGRKIKFLVKDDCYGTPGFGCTGNPSTVANTRALLASPVFATVGSLGTPTQDSVRSLLKSNGVPQLYVNSGSKDWNNAKQYPGLFGWQPSYNEEGKIFGKYIKKTYPTAKVCFLGQADDFGADGLAGLQAAGVTPTKSEMYSPGGLVVGGASYFGPFITDFATAGCSVVVLDTIPGATDAALADATLGGYSPHWIISNVGSDPVTVGVPLAAFPKDPEVGAVSFSYLPTLGSNSPWIKWEKNVLTKYDPAFTSQLHGQINGNLENGVGWAVSFVEALKATGRNLTRASFLKTLTSTTFKQTPSLTPLQYTASNHQGISGGYLTVITSATSAKPLTGAVYTTTSSNSSPIVFARNLSTGIPAWLK